MYFQFLDVLTDEDHSTANKQVVLYENYMDP